MNRKRYEVSWAKTYYATGTEIVEAESEEKAEAMVMDSIGEFTGSMQYDPNEDYVETMGEAQL
jgi:hypothetical protein